MAFKKHEEVQKIETPKLSFQHLQEITDLVTLHKGTHNLLKHWGMVELDEKGYICAIKDYSGQSNDSVERYHSYQPLKGIRYSSIIPYNDGREWLASWSVWLKARWDNHEDRSKKTEDLVCKREFKELFENLRMLKSKII